MAEKYFPHAREDELRGPFALTDETVGKAHPQLYGVYLLCKKGEKGATVVTYVGVGRIKERLAEHLETRRGADVYVKALADETTGAKEECRLFHKYGKCSHLDNSRHPPLPTGAKRCPVSGCNGRPD